MSGHQSTPKPQPQPTPKVFPVFGPMALGKSLFWNDKCEQMYFVDGKCSEIHRYDPKTDDHVAAKVGDGDKRLGFAISIATIANRFIIGLGADIAEITWDGKSESVEDFKVLATVDSTPDIRINSGTVTPRGSLLVGTHSPYGEDGKPQKNNAGLYLYKNNEVTQILSGVTVANGMAFSRCRKKFYFTDSKTRKVDSFCYSTLTEEFMARKVFFDFEEKNIKGVPVGIMVDSEGHVWITSYGGGLIIRVDKNTNTELLRVEFEACQITSSCFSGSFLREMYVTSARYDMTDAEIEKYPKAGYFFRLTNLGSVRGLPCLAFCPDSAK